jgi:formiminotetrahydrofolate cyclodeaminase
MVCRYTAGRPRFELSQSVVTRVLERAEELRRALAAAVERDAAAYGSYARAAALPRSTPDERRTRSRALQEALRASTEVPLDVAERSAEVLALAVEAAASGNPSLISDAAVAAELAEAARRSADLNVRLNARGLQDADFVAACARRLDEAAARAAGQRERAHAIVMERSR